MLISPQPSGLPNPHYFLYDTLEASAALPNRWKPTPNEPVDPPSSSSAVAAGTTQKSKSTSTSTTKDKDPNSSLVNPTPFTRCRPSRIHRTQHPPQDRPEHGPAIRHRPGLPAALLIRTRIRPDQVTPERTLPRRCRSDPDVRLDGRIRQDTRMLHQHLGRIARLDSGTRGHAV